MNVFSKNAMRELSHCNLKPYPILSVQSEKQPRKQIMLNICVEKRLQNDEKIFVSSGTIPGCKSVTKGPSDLSPHNSLPVALDGLST